MAVEQKIKGNKTEMQIVVASDGGEVFLSWVVLQEQSVNLGGSSCLAPCSYKSRIQGIVYSRNCVLLHSVTCY